MRLLQWCQRIWIPRLGENKLIVDIVELQNIAWCVGGTTRWTNWKSNVLVASVCEVVQCLWHILWRDVLFHSLHLFLESCFGFWLGQDVRSDVCEIGFQDLKMSTIFLIDSVMVFELFWHNNDSALVFSMQNVPILRRTPSQIWIVQYGHANVTI